MAGICQIVEFYCIFFTKYFRILAKKAKILALFCPNGGISQNFRFYCIFFTEYFRILAKKAKILAFLALFGARDEKSTFCW